MLLVGEGAFVVALDATVEVKLITVRLGLTKAISLPFADQSLDLHANPILFAPCGAALHLRSVAG
jgi:hypothetical protein